MSPNQRIALNVAATYARSLYTLIIGLLCGRWTLQILGEVDLGLMGLVGGLTVFISFFNSLLAQSVSRFYAYAVGMSMAEGRYEEGLLESRKWFTAALSIHLVVPTVLLIMGYSVGELAVRYYLTIPVDRIADCLWVWRFCAISVYLGMISVPFNAMYNAKQEIAELTLYGFATSTLNVCFMYYALTHPGRWLVAISAWTMFLGLAPKIIIVYRALHNFPECRIVRSAIFESSRIRRIFTFSFYAFLCEFSYMLTTNGVSVLVNKCFGPQKNAAMGIGQSVAGHSMTFSGALSGAFVPAITNKAGTGDLDGMRRMAYRISTLSTVGVLVFALPLMFEVEEVMVLWLKNPPADSGKICICMLLAELCNRISDGHWLAIRALGKVGVFSVVESVIWLMVLPMGYFVASMGSGVVGVCVILVAAKFLAIFVKLIFGHMIAGLSARYWLRRVFLPIVLASASAICVELGVMYYLPRSFTRIIISTLVMESVFLPLVWRFVLSDEDRVNVKRAVGRKMSKLFVR